MHKGFLPLHKPRGTLDSEIEGGRDALYIQGTENWEGIEAAYARTGKESETPYTQIENLLRGLRERYRVALGVVHPGSRVDGKVTKNRIRLARRLIETLLIQDDEREELLSDLISLERDFRIIPRNTRKS